MDDHMPAEKVGFERSPRTVDQTVVHEIKLRPGSIAWWLATAAGLLILAYVVGFLTTFLISHQSLYTVVHVLNLDGEGNLPSYFSASLLLFSASIAALTTALTRLQRDQYHRHWAIMSVILLFMAIDEASVLHELLVKPTRDLLGWVPAGIFNVAWIIPGSAVCLAIGLVFRRFWRHLPRKTRLLMLMSAILFCGGAVGIEAIGGYALGDYNVRRDGPNVTYLLLVVLEEGLEMSGVIVLIYSLLDYIRHGYGRVHCRLTHAR